VCSESPSIGGNFFHCPPLEGVSSFFIPLWRG
jgi:hypothetical protein